MTTARPTPSSSTGRSPDEAAQGRGAPVADKMAHLRQAVRHQYRLRKSLESAGVIRGICRAWRAPRHFETQPHTRRLGQLRPKLGPAAQSVSNAIGWARYFKPWDWLTACAAWFNNEAGFGGGHSDNFLLEGARGILHSETPHTVQEKQALQLVGTVISTVNDIPRIFGSAMAIRWFGKAKQSIREGDLKEDPYHAALIRRIASANWFIAVPAIAEKVFQISRAGFFGATVLFGVDMLAESFTALFLARCFGISAFFGAAFASGPTVNRTEHEKSLLEVRADARRAGKTIADWLAEKLVEPDPETEVSDPKELVNDAAVLRDEMYLACAQLADELCGLEAEIAALEASKRQGLGQKILDRARSVPSPDLQGIEEEINQKRTEQVQKVRSHIAKIDGWWTRAQQQVTGDSFDEAVVRRSKASVLLQHHDHDDSANGLVKARRLNMGQVAASFSTLFDISSAALFSGMVIGGVIQKMGLTQMGDVLLLGANNFASRFGIAEYQDPASLEAQLTDWNAVLGGMIEPGWYVMGGLTMLGMVGPMRTLYKSICDQHKAKENGHEVDADYYRVSFWGELLKFLGLSMRFIPVLRPISLILVAIGTYLERVLGRWHNKRYRKKFKERIGRVNELKEKALQFGRWFAPFGNYF